MKRRDLIKLATAGGLLPAPALAQASASANAQGERYADGLHFPPRGTVRALEAAEAALLEDEDPVVDEGAVGEGGVGGGPLARRRRSLRPRRRRRRRRSVRRAARAGLLDQPTQSPRSGATHEAERPVRRVLESPSTLTPER